MRNLSQAFGAAFAAVALLFPITLKAADGEDRVPPSSATWAVQQAQNGEAALGDAVSDSVLAAQRGGADLHINENDARGTVTDNVARNVSTGNNTISDNAFSNMNGIPVVVQNSGNNVLIQNSTILNLQMK